MRRRSFGVAVLVVLLLESGVFSQTRSSSNNLQAELERLHSQWFTAFDHGDGAAMDQMELPNLILVNTDGTGDIWHRPRSRVGQVKPTGVSSRTLSNTEVRQFGEVAILTGLVTSRAGEKVRQMSTTVVWVRQNNRWLVASAQWTEVPQK